MLEKASFDSNNRYLRLHMKGHVDVNTNGTSAFINHNLGYIPYFKLFVKLPGRTTYSPLNYGPVYPDGYFDYETYIISINTSNIEIAISNFTLDPDTLVPVYYRIYAEPQAA